MNCILGNGSDPGKSGFPVNRGLTVPLFTVPLNLPGFLPSPRSLVNGGLTVVGDRMYRSNITISF